MPRLLRALYGIGRRTRTFARATQGNVAIVFGFSLIPIVGLVGLGVDYGVALTDKAKLDNAADAAAIAAVATAKAYVAANQSDQNLASDSLAAGLNAASRAFTVNAGNVPFAAIPTPQTSTSTVPATNTCASGSACIYLAQSGQTFTSTVYYATSTQNHFGQIFGTKVMNIQGTSASSAQIPSYLDFYLLIDVSGSMGLPSTTAGQTQLIGLNTKSPDPFPNATQGCNFACHYPGYHGWTLATTNNIQLRTGAVNSAVCSLLAQAGNPTVPNQYRVGLYPFVTSMGTLSALSSNLTNASLNATCASSNPQAFTNLLDTGTTQEYTSNNPSTGTGSGGTHFDAVLPAIQSVISQGAGFGTGATSSNSQPFVFLITDGMENPQHYGSYQYNVWNYPGNPSTFSGYNNANFDGSTPQAITSSQCSALKNAGAKISILYIPYLPISSNTDPYGEVAKANTAIPNLPSALVNCATPGYFYTANTPADITNSLNAMFQQAIQAAHLTQ